MEDNRKNKKKFQYIAIGVVLLLINVVVAITLIMKDKQKKEQGSNTEPETTTHVDTYEELVAKGDEYSNGGDNDKAIEEYLKALELDNKADLKLKVANIYIMEGTEGKGLSYLYQILDDTKGAEEGKEIRVSDQIHI